MTHYKLIWVMHKYNVMSIIKTIFLILYIILTRFMLIKYLKTTTTPKTDDTHKA